MAPPQFPANTGDARCPQCCHISRHDLWLYVSGQEMEWEESSTAGIPTACANEGFRKTSFIFLDVFRLLSLGVDSKISMCEPIVIP